MALALVTGIPLISDPMCAISWFIMPISHSQWGKLFSRYFHTHRSNPYH